MDAVYRYNDLYFGKGDSLISRKTDILVNISMYSFTLVRKIVLQVWNNSDKNHNDYIFGVLLWAIFFLIVKVAACSAFWQSACKVVDKILMLCHLKKDEWAIWNEMN